MVFLQCIPYWHRHLDTPLTNKGCSHTSSVLQQEGGAITKQLPHTGTGHTRDR